MKKEENKESITEEISKTKDSNDLVDEVFNKSKKPKVKLIGGVLLILLIIVIIGIGIISWNMFGSKEVSVASVNNESISQTDFDAFFAQQEPIFTSQGLDTTDPEQLQTAKSQVLETLINQRLLLQAAEEAGIVLTAEEIQKEYDNSVSQFESVEVFKTALSENNLTEDTFKERIRVELTIQKYLATQIAENVTVSDEEIQALYDQYVAQGSNVPAMAEITSQLSDQVKQQKRDSQVGEVIGALREGSEIETYLE